MSITRLPKIASVVITFSLPKPTLAAQSLPIVSGRYSNEICSKPTPASTRYFKLGSTSTSNQRCKVVIKNINGKVYTAHLVCSYEDASNDEDDVVLKVDSPMELTWINQCMEIQYHFCGK